MYPADGEPGDFDDAGRPDVVVVWTRIYQRRLPLKDASVQKIQLNVAVIYLQVLQLLMDNIQVVVPNVAN